MDTSEAEILMLAANDVLAEYTNNTHHPVPIWGRQQAALLFNTEWLWKQGWVGGGGWVGEGGEQRKGERGGKRATAAGEEKERARQWLRHSSLESQRGNLSISPE